MSKYFIKTESQSLTNINETLQKTYMLLATTILFSFFTTLISIFCTTKSSFLLFVLSVGLLFAIEKYKDNFIGLMLVFTYAGLMGFIIGPLISTVLKIKNSEITIAYSLLTTGMIFISLSIYTLTSKKNFNFRDKI